jgi:PAS domain S-box-containing protein
MAPEQAAGRLDLINQRTDVYGLGAILYEILTGSPPFAGDSAEEVLRKVREEDPAPPWQIWPEVPPALAELCLRALAKQSANRPAAAADLALEVQGWQEFERRKAEEALRDSEALYQSLVESLPCCVARKDLEGRFTFANQRLCEMVGLSLDQLLGKTDFDFFPKELAERDRRGDEQVIASGQMLDIVEEHVAPSGEKLYVQVMKTPLYGPDGKAIGIQGIFWDVTARKRAEDKLRKSRERFELAVQGSQDGLWDWDLETNQIWGSPRLREMLGYDEQESPPMMPGALERVHPDDRDRWRAAFQGHVEGLTDQLELE